ncbi:MAG: hypothetical protein ACK4S8_14355 [Alishewanella aestuarii]
MASRANRRTDGSRLMFLADLHQLTKHHLPETVNAPRDGDLWGMARLRPEVATVIDALARRHTDSTGKAITKSEIMAAALNLSLPVLATRMFPAKVAK